MKTDEQFHAEVRAMLHRRAEDVGNGVDLDDIGAVPLSREPARARRRVAPRVLAAAATVAVVVTAVVAADSAGDRRDRTGVQTRPASPADAKARVWPLSAEKLPPGEVPEYDLRTATTAGLAYLVDVAGLPGDWPMGETVTPRGDRDRATVHYVLQDAPATVEVARDPSTDSWYVTGAANDRAPLLSVEVDGQDVVVEIGAGDPSRAGPRHVRLTAVAADGNALGVHFDDSVVGQQTTVRWTLGAVPAVVRADVMDDHDANPTTPDVVIGHAAIDVDGGRPTG